ncbi:hypothetical protein [uncultured Alistipes sp.]|nr:hypothetical protein [uncultured Alistipes sp.]
MDFTSRMAALLGAFRRERNGASTILATLIGVPLGCASTVCLTG